MTILNSVEATQAYGAQWAASAQPGQVLALHGHFGVGKTQLVKGIASGLGCRDHVTSPTFSLIHEYEGGRLPLYHLDLYRLETLEEALRLGIEDYLPSPYGLTVIEWPDIISTLLPPGTQHYELEMISFEERLIRISS